jgi:hypothetical protein
MAQSHALFKGGRLSGLDALVNAQADLLCADLAAAAAAATATKSSGAAQAVPLADCCTAGDNNDNSSLDTACSVQSCAEQQCSQSHESCTLRQVNGSSNSSSSSNSESSRASLPCTRSADAHTTEVEAQAGEVEMVSLLQHHTLAIIHAYLTGAQVADCAEQAQLAPSYIAAVVEIRYAMHSVLENCTLY